MTLQIRQRQIESPLKRKRVNVGNGVTDFLVQLLVVKP